MHTMRRSSVVVTTTPGLLPTEVAVAEGGDLGQGFMTRPLFTEPHRRRSRKMNGLAESPEYPRHLFLIVRPECGGSHVTQRTYLQEVGAQGFVVRCLEDGDHVVGSYCPISLLQLQAMFLGDLTAVVGTLLGLLDVPYALVGPVYEDHVAGHMRPPPFSHPAYPVGPGAFHHRHDAILTVLAHQAG